MVTKCVRKLMQVIIIEFLIFILLSVQANHPTPTSFFPSLPPIQPHDSSKLDGYIYFCLSEEIKEKCARIKSKWPFPDFEYENCIYLSFKHCLRSYFHESPKEFHLINSCIRKDCLPKLKISSITSKSFILVRCLLECYEEHLKKPMQVQSF